MKVERRGKEDGEFLFPIDSVRASSLGRNERRGIDIRRVRVE